MSSVAVQRFVGVWRSQVAHLLWEQGVGGSNPLTPTILASGPQLRGGCAEYQIGVYTRDPTPALRIRSPTPMNRFPRISLSGSM